jgi:hypothetical protein
MMSLRHWSEFIRTGYQWYICNDLERTATGRNHHTIGETMRLANKTYSI